MEDRDVSARRSRTVYWRSPLETAAVGLTMSGLDYLRAIQEQRLPPGPLFSLLGLELEHVAEGHIIYATHIAEYHYNRLGAVHGGLTATLADSAMGSAVHTLLGPRQRYSTVELTVNYTRALREDSGRVRSEGRVIHRGERTAVAEARVVDRHGRLFAHATSTCLLWNSTANTR